MNQGRTCEPAPEGRCPNDKNPCFISAKVDGYHLATMRASRKGSVVVSVKLFDSIDPQSVEVGRILFHHKKELPGDCVEPAGCNGIIFLNARLKDYDRMMDLIRGDCGVGIEFSGDEWENGRAYLKSLCHIFPQRSD